MAVSGIEATKFYSKQRKSTDSTQTENATPEQLSISSSTAASSVERYKLEWQELLTDLKEGAEERIRERAYAGDLKVSKFRSIYWALLLRVLNEDYADWQNQRKLQRSRYERLKHEFCKNPHEFETPDDDPLSQSTKSIWNQYFSDQELFAVIRQDVIRTFPGVDFFRKPLIQNSMCNVLFYYAREHPYMCYRQGMHEILAPILFVIYSDHQSLLHFMEISKTEVDPLLFDVMNPDYFDSDTYSIFARLMSSIEAYYRVTNLDASQSNVLRNNFSPLVSTEIEVIGQLNSIRDKILAKEDLHLHNYLLKLDIPLHIFGIRWLRLLFGREFPLLDLLLLWDAIFADGDSFNLPSYILVAMLIRIRDKLLLSDYTSCLTYLMRYPAKSDVNLILQHALHMHMPKKFERPANAFVYFTAQATVSSEKLRKDNKSSSIAMKRKDMDKKSQRLRSTSLNSGGSSGSVGLASSPIEKHISVLQTFNAANAASQARLNQQLASDQTIIDGYSSNSPELMRLELKNAQTVVSIARNKLSTYLDVIKKHTFNSKMKSEELTHAIDGLEELCTLLDVKYMFPLHIRRAPIEEAFEANESNKSRLTPEERNSCNSQQASKFENNQQNSETVSTDKTLLQGGNLAYERPDDCYFNTMRLLGNMREIELLPITTDEKIVTPSNFDSNKS